MDRYNHRSKEGFAADFCMEGNGNWVKHSDAEAEIAEYKTKWMDAENANTKQAHEIAELRKGLQSIANNTCCDRCQEASLVAKTTLEKNDG